MAKKKRKATSSEHKVGRGKPPTHTQFRKGMSGNPQGRPKGSKNLSTYFMEVAEKQVIATIDGKSRRISMVQAITMQLATKAAAGDQPAINKFLDWIDEIETRAAAARPAQFPLEQRDVEVLRAAYERMKQCDPDEVKE